MFGTQNEIEMSGPGFHSTPNVPANFIWPGIEKFLAELSVFPESIRHQVRHSLKLYCQVRANNKHEIVIPTYHEGFMKFFEEKEDSSYLGYAYSNRPKAG